ncbi:hypothetical protein LINPERHAP1_LOCUS23059 [Linum perenne]
MRSQAVKQSVEDIVVLARISSWRRRERFRNKWLLILGAVGFATMLSAVIVSNSMEEITDLFGAAIAGLEQTFIFFINDIWCFTLFSGEQL